MLAASLLVLLGLPMTSAQPLVWDATSKRYEAKIGETNVFFTFYATNRSSFEILIRAIRTSCGCTIAKIPTIHWRMAPGTNTQMEVAVDLRGKRGLVSKPISVDTSAGLSVLTVNVNIPDPDPREMNRTLAQADRQAIFKNACANCHAHPADGQKGETLYKLVCGICHDSDHRASMVPDLKTLQKPTDKNYWDTWVRHGKPGTLMPAFSKLAGGPLDDEQIESLVTYLTEPFLPARSSDFGDPFAEPSRTNF